jgi:hypothetical protein
MSRVDLYFDYISPYAYLGWVRLRALCREVGAELCAHPVLFAGLLNHLRTLTFICIALFIKSGSEFPRREMVETHVCSHTSDPWTEGALLIKGVEPLMRTYERLLCQILSFSTLMQDAITDIENARLVAHDQLAKGLSIAATGTLDQLAVRGRIHG